MEMVIVCVMGSRQCKRCCLIEASQIKVFDFTCRYGGCCVEHSESNVCSSLMYIVKVRYPRNASPKLTEA